jgi:hypothetical protein
MQKLKIVNKIAKFIKKYQTYIVNLTIIKNLGVEYNGI